MSVSILHIIFKASQPRGRASGSRAYGRHEIVFYTYIFSKQKTPRQVERVAGEQKHDIVILAELTCMAIIYFGLYAVTL